VASTVSISSAAQVLISVRQGAFKVAAPIAEQRTDGGVAAEGKPTWMSRKCRLIPQTSRSTQPDADRRTDVWYSNVRWMLREWLPSICVNGHRLIPPNVRVPSDSSARRASSRHECGASLNPSRGTSEIEGSRVHDV
jgi:hypothetical protein